MRTGYVQRFQKSASGGKEKKSKWNSGISIDLFKGGGGGGGKFF